MPESNWEAKQQEARAAGEKAGLHFDGGKRDWSLLPFEAIEGLVGVLEYGAQKYGRTNWKKGIAFTRVWNSAMRHLIAWRAGQDIDPESKLQHLSHALCNLMFLAFYSQSPTLMVDFDDRVLPLETTT